MTSVEVMSFDDITATEVMAFYEVPVIDNCMAFIFVFRPHLAVFRCYSSEITPGSIRGTVWMPRIKSRSAMIKINTLPTVLLLLFQRDHSLFMTR